MRIRRRKQLVLLVNLTHHGSQRVNVLYTATGVIAMICKVVARFGKEFKLKFAETECLQKYGGYSRLTCPKCFPSSSCVKDLGDGRSSLKWL